MVVDEISDGEVEETRRFEISSEINFDMDASGNILGIEILDASQSLRPEVIARATNL